jgi:hypothetical protein
MRVLALVLLLGAQQPKPKQVVFVCEHGTVKSVVAVEHFNRLAKERGLNVRAISRGTKPDSTVPGPVAAGLKGDGFDVSAFRARPFTREDLASSLMVVALDAPVESVVGAALPVVRWDGMPAVSENYGVARTAIVDKVKRLVDSLAKRR